MLKFNNKNILVTGGAGMIGKHLIKLLQKKDCNIFVVDLQQPEDIDNIHYRSADLTNYDECLTICDGMDIVFSLVGIKASPKIIKSNPADIITPMLQFNTNVMRAAMKKNVEWFLYTSSIGVYPPAKLFLEDDVWNGFPSKLDWFGGWAKRMGELQANAYVIQNGKSNISIIRPANVYGEYDNFDPKSAMVIPSLIRKGYECNSISVWGDGSQVRDFIYAGDVARAMLHLVERKVVEPINIGSGSRTTIKEIANLVASEFGKDIVWNKKKTMGDDVRLMDTKRAISYGFKPEVNLKDGIIKTINWFRKNIKIIDKKYHAFS